MTVKVEKIEGGMPHTTIMVAGLIASVVFIYLTYINVLTDTQLFSFFGGLATVAALVWGSHTIKHLCSYGIGTGVPSAGMIAFGSGVIAMLFATKYGVAAPVVAVVLAAVIGLILGYVANNVLNAHSGHDPVPRRDGNYRGSCPDGLRSHDDRFL
jgi:tetrahydromethanopterin S-methyltransferase subunit C